MKKMLLAFYDFPVLILITLLVSNQLIIIHSSPYLFDDINELPNKQTALVLGAAKLGQAGYLNPYFKYRMEAAAELYFAGKVEQILVSGDNHIATYDEATDMANYLVELGVPRDRIILDYAGFRTLDSVIRAKKVFHCQELIIVSQKFHNQRAVYAARNFGIDAVGYNARDVENKNNFTHFREYLAKFVMVLDIHCLQTQPKFL